MRNILLTVLLLTLATAAPLAAAAGGPQITGFVVDADGAPVAGARVEFRPAADPYRDGLALRRGTLRPEASGHTATGAGGGYRLSAPRPGLWWLRVTAEGKVPMRTPPLPLVQDRHLPELTLERDAEAELRVADADDRPVSGALVRTLSPRQLVAIRRRAPWQPARRQGTTDARGRVRVPRLPGELLTAWAIRAGSWQGTAEVGGAPVTLTLSEGRSRPVRVLRADGSPAAGVLVVAGTAAWPLTVTGEDGRATLVGPDEGALPQGALSLRLVLPAGWTVRADLPPPPEPGEEPEPVPLRLPPEGALEGRVVDADSRTPVAGALVWLESAPSRAVLSDERGRFVFRDTPPGEPFVHALAAGRLETVERPVLPAGETARAVVALRPAAAVAGRVSGPQGDGVEAVQVIAAVDGAADGDDAGPRLETRTAADGSFRLGALDPRQAYRLYFRHPGFVTARRRIGTPGASDLRVELEPRRSGLGRVLDLAEEPVAGAAVRLGAVDATGQESDSVRTAATDREGVFAMPRLDAGRFVLAVQADGFAPGVVPGVDVPGDTARVDLGTVVLGPQAVLRGRVEDADGNPVAQAELRTVERRLPLLEPATATSDDSGRFRLTGLGSDERVVLRVEREGYVPLRSPEIGADRDEPVTLVLQPAVTIAGTVVSAGGGPIAGARVHLEYPRAAGARAATDPDSRSAGPVVTGEDGRFELQDVRPGTVRLEAGARGWLDRELAALEVPPRRGVEGLEVVLERGGTVEGRVLSAAGEPVAACPVYVVRPDGRGRENETVTDGDGRFRLTGVAPGPARVAARHRRHGTAERSLEVETGTRRVELRFPPGTEVRGRVVDDAGVGLADAEVVLTSTDPAEPEIRARTEATGRYRLRPVPPGRFNLAAEKAGYARVELPEPLDVTSTPVDAPRLVLTTGGSIAGRLLGVEPTELAAVEVLARGASTPGTGQPGRVFHDGRYRVPELRPGEYVVVARIPLSGRQAQGRVELEEGAAEARLDLDFDSGLRCAGRVLYRGRGLSGAELTLVGLGRPARASATADGRGRFNFTGVVPGLYRLEIVDEPRGVQASRVVVMDGDRELTVEVFGGAVSGRVTDREGGEGLPGVRLRLDPLAPPDAPVAGRVRETTTDSSGRFHLGAVTEGRYRVTATRFGYLSAVTEVAVEPGGEVRGLGIELARAPQSP